MQIKASRHPTVNQALCGKLISEWISELQRLNSKYNYPKRFFMVPKNHLEESVKLRIISRLEAG